MNALELANCLDDLTKSPATLTTKEATVCITSAAELRRLHAINAELVESLEKSLRGEWTIGGDMELLNLIEKAKQ